MTGKSKPKLITYSGPTYQDQYWQLEESAEHPGNYQIKNAVHKNYRIAGQHTGNLFGFDGSFYTDQLWFFEREKGTKYFRIVNHANKGKLQKNG